MPTTPQTLPSPKRSRDAPPSRPPLPPHPPAASYRYNIPHTNIAPTTPHTAAPVAPRETLFPALLGTRLPPTTCPAFRHTTRVSAHAMGPLPFFAHAVRITGLACRTQASYVPLLLAGWKAGDRVSSAGEPDGVPAPREGQSTPAAGGLPSASAEM